MPPSKTMIQPDSQLRFACGIATLFVTLGLCWLFEAVLAPSANSLIGSCCAGWRSIQFLPYFGASYATAPAQDLSDSIFWLLFTLQWFLFGSLIVSRVVAYFRRIADLLHQESEPLPERHAIITA